MPKSRFAIACLLCLAGAGCHEATALSELPPLDRPIPGPPPEPVFGNVDELNLQIENDHGDVIEEIDQRKPFRVRLSFRRLEPADSPKQQVHIRLVRYDQNRVPTIADQTLGVPQSANNQDFSLIVDLTSPPIPGAFHVVVYFHKQVLDETPLRVLDE